MPHVAEQFRSPAAHGAVISPARDELRRGLQNYYLDVALPDEKFPLAASFRRLLEALDTAETPSGHGFAAELVAGVPHLSRSALSLNRDATESDDLVQYTLLEAREHRTS
ncbi:hypothetical protein ACN9MF_10480 [Methylobacterium fujisawaense]|uniref:hypothetical protein n=1 Tax=Methylobacterium fujisawaense TaxID=107400 RepID=UPI003CE9B0C0